MHVSESMSLNACNWMNGRRWKVRRRPQSLTVSKWQFERGEIGAQIMDHEP
jgi:hypothetical protein